MSNENSPVIKIASLGQICMVVRDVQKSMEEMWTDFGIGPWNIFDSEPSHNDEMTYYCKPVKFSIRIAMTQKRLGGIQVELIQPLEGDTIHRDFPRDHGEGVHHWGHVRLDSREAFDKAKSDLEKAGFPCMMGAARKGLAYAYFDTTRVLKTITEVVWGDPAVPPPYKIRVFPE